MPSKKNKPSESLAMERKIRSEKILEEYGIPSVDHLPVITDGNEEASIRSKEDIAKRAIAIAIVAAKAEGLGKKVEGLDQEIEKMIHTHLADDFFTDQERAFIDASDPDQRDAANYSWQYECCWVLLWALGYIEKLNYPGTMCDVSKIFDIIEGAGAHENLVENSKPQKPGDVLDEADLIYRYSWACTNARMHGEEAPGGLNSGVVLERHRALNWLRNYFNADWDDVSMDT